MNAASAAHPPVGAESKADPVRLADRARIWDRVQKSPQNRDFWTLLYFSGTCDVQEKGKSIPLALSNAAASSTFGDSSDDEQAILIGQGEQSPSMHAGQGASPVARASQTGVEETSGAASLG